MPVLPLLLLLLLILAIAGYLAPVRFHLSAAYDETGFHARLVLSALSGLYRQERNWPSRREEAAGEHGQEEAEKGPARRLAEFLDTLAAIRTRFAKYGFGGMLASFFISQRHLPWLDVVGALERKGRFRRLYWGTEIGLEEAAATAWAVGLTWVAKAAALAFLDRRYRIPARTARLNVKPSFGRPIFQTFVDCIFTLRAGQIIRASLSGFILHRLRRLLSHERRSSHRRPDENGHAEH